MKEKLSDLCREQKQTITPHKTNQDVAENTDLSVGTVSQFFRGDIKNPSVYTVGPICREMGVSMDEYFGIPHDEPAEPSDSEKLLAETAALRAQLAQQQNCYRVIAKTADETQVCFSFRKSKSGYKIVSIAEL